MKTNNIKKEFIDKQVVAFSKNDNDNKLFNRHKIIISLINKFSKKDANILDVGCFDGKILKTLEKMGYKNLYGVDFADTPKNIFKNTSINFATCDIEKGGIPFHKKFDVVIFSDVLEHFFSPQTILYDLKEKLNKYGVIIFSVPNAGWFLNGLLLSFFPSKLFMSTAFGPWGHTYQFTFFQIKKIANNLKLKIIELSGGKMDNFAFKTGFKKIIYDLFVIISYPLISIYPQIFSDHIFGVLQNTRAILPDKNRLELGD